MVPPNQLDSTEQDALVKQIGLALLRAAPEDWERVTVDYRAVGRYSEVAGEIVYADDEVGEWPVPPEIASMFAQLRAGMYRDGRGTWFNATYRLDHPSSYNLDYDRDEPEWRRPPPPQAYADDLQTFPRTPDNVPEWLTRRLSNKPVEPPPGPGPRFRMARIFDGQGAGGRPVVNRPTVPERDRGSLLEYLNSAPVISSSRVLEVDRLDPDGRQVVPVAFHTDGTWIWPAAVNFYLRGYGISPELELVEHIRRQGYRVPEVDEITHAAAVGFLGRGGPAAPPPPRQPAGPPPAPRRPAPPPTMAMPRPEPDPHGDGSPLRRDRLADAPPPNGGFRPPVVAPPPRSGPPPAALPSQGPPSATIDTLRSRLTTLGVPESAYRIGPPAERTWTMDQTPEGWRVAWYERDFVAPAIFEDVADAAAFLLGKVMLDTHRPEPATPPAEVATVRSGPVERPDHEPAPGIAEPAARRDLEPGVPEPAAFADRFERSPGGAELFEPRHTQEPEPAMAAPPLGAPEPAERHAREPEPTMAEEPDGQPTVFAPSISGSDPAPRRSREPQPTVAAPRPGAEPAERRAREPQPTMAAPSLGPDPALRHIREPDPTMLAPGLPEPNTRHTREPDPTMLAPGLPEPGTRHTREPEFTPGLPEPGTRHTREPDFTPGLPDRTDPNARRTREPDPTMPAPGPPEPGTRHTREPEPTMPAPGLPEWSEPVSRRAREPEPTMLAPSVPEPGPRRAREPEPAVPERAAEPENRRAAQPAQRWPIQPLSGEPPLTLFRGKRMLDLAPGTEVDRFGNPDGNLTYAAGTRFAERSLVPDWIERPYHTYRVERPIQALAGTAIPWFEQEGGGTAYLLPEAIEELLANGTLSEVPGRKPPTG